MTGQIAVGQRKRQQVEERYMKNMVNHLPLGVEAKALHAVHVVKHFTILASTCVHYKKDRTSIPVYRRKGMSRRSPAA